MSGTLTHIRGDLFDTSHEVIGHGCNCSGGFASGVAGQVRKRFPQAYRAYSRKHEKDGWKLGDVQVVMCDGHRKYVANMGTQQNFGKDGRQYVDYEGLRLAVVRLLDICRANGWGLAIPKIGCGLGGGDWAVVEAIIRDELVGRAVDVEVYSQ